MGKTIFFGNYKGGVGKTTSAYNLAVELAKRHFRRILLIDLDPQSSLSEVCMTAYSEARIDIDRLGREETLNYIYTVYMQAQRIGGVRFVAPLGGVIKSANAIDFIPNSLFSEFGGLDRIGMDIGNDVQNLLILRNFIEDNNLSRKYDFIFFDCPPSNNLITQSAFLYSDYYIIPTIMDPLSVQGVKHYVSVIRRVYADHCQSGEYADALSLLFGGEPQLIGVFETMRKGPTKTDTYRNMIREAGYFVFDTVIRDKNQIALSLGQGDESSQGGDGENDDYVRLAEEFMTRFKSLEGR